MESPSKIVHMNLEVIDKIIRLLEQTGHKYWRGYFEYILPKLRSGENTDEIVIELRNIFKGGMGSFNDLVLQKNHRMFIEENDQLLDLKRELFNLVEKKYKLNFNNKNVLDFDSKKTKDDAG